MKKFLLLLSTVALMSCSRYVAVFKSQLSNVTENGISSSEHIAKCGNPIVPKRTSIKCGTYENNKIKIIFEGSHKSISCTIFNKTSDKVYVNWEEAQIIYPDNTTDFIVNSSTEKFQYTTVSRSSSNAFASSTPGNSPWTHTSGKTVTQSMKETNSMIVFPNTPIKQFITRKENADKFLLPITSKFKRKLLSYYSNFVNQSVKLYIPIEINEEKYDYIFEFSIYDIIAI